jgi:hypothetical protein
VTGPSRCNFPWRGKDSGVAVVVPEIPCCQFPVNHALRHGTPNATPLRLALCEPDIRKLAGAADERELIPSELSLLRHFPGQISGQGGLGHRPGNGPQAYGEGTGEAFARRPNSRASSIEIDLFRSSG